MEKFSSRKAYNNIEFLNSPAAREVRILSEYILPKERFKEHKIKSTIVAFGSARSHEKNVPGNAPAHLQQYHEEAIQLCQKITQWSMEKYPDDHEFVICSGGGPGMMEAANKGASLAGGTNAGLSISLPFEDKPNPYITDGLDLEFHYFFMRKFWLLKLAKAAIIFPGGLGTLDEFFELMTLIQTQKIARPFPIILYGKDFWCKTINFDHLIEFGVINAKDKKLFDIVDNVEDAYSTITTKLLELT